MGSANIQDRILTPIITIEDYLKATDFKAFVELKNIFSRNKVQIVEYVKGVRIGDSIHKV